MKLQSYWRDSVARRLYPKLMGSHSCDVAIVGAGITGLTAGYLLRSAGLSVTLLEKSTVGAGETGLTTAHITELLDVKYQDLCERLGTERARALSRGARSAMDGIAKCVRDGQIACDYQSLPAFLFAERAKDIAPLEREMEHLVQVGIPAVWEREAPLPFLTLGAIRVENQAQFHPLAYLQALAKQFTALGGKLCENSFVQEVLEKETRCCIKTPEGNIDATHVILATHVPITNRVFLQTKIASYRTYVLGAEVEKYPDPPGLFYDMETPYHYIRSATVENREVLLVGGADHKTGERHKPEHSLDDLSDYLHSHFSVRELRYQWSGQMIESIDGLPFIGRNALHDRVFVATGYSGTGMVFGTMAAHLLADHILERPSELQEMVKSTRVGSIGSLPRYVRENADFPIHLIADRIRGAEDVGDLRPEEGAVVWLNGEKVAAYRERAGDLHLVGAVCPHLGCVVQFNSVERTWDCPCHGSRFSIDGEVLNGPAESNLPPVTQPIPKEKLAG